MDIAAQQVQGKVQRVARHGDDEEHHHVAGDGAQGVEHLGNDAARQHQSHQTGIGQDVPKYPVTWLYREAEDPSDLAEALCR